MKLHCQCYHYYEIRVDKNLSGGGGDVVVVIVVAVVVVVVVDHNENNIIQLTELFLYNNFSFLITLRFYVTFYYRLKILNLKKKKKEVKIDELSFTYYV